MSPLINLQDGANQARAYATIHFTLTEPAQYRLSGYLTMDSDQTTDRISSVVRLDGPLVYTYEQFERTLDSSGQNHPADLYLNGMSDAFGYESGSLVGFLPAGPHSISIDARAGAHFGNTSGFTEEGNYVFTLSPPSASALPDSGSVSWPAALLWTLMCLVASTRNNVQPLLSSLGKGK